MDPEDGALEPTEVLRDPARLAALRQLAVLDSPDESFDRRTRLASRILDAPIALVTFIGAERQFIKSAVGLPEPWARERDLATDWGFCPLVVGRDGPLLIDDARRDDRLADNPIVADLGAMAFLGVPLVDKDGNVLGTICALDVRPRAWAADHVELLSAFAESLVTQLELQMELERNQRLVAIGTRAANREHLRARQLRGLAEASLLVTSTVSPVERLRIIAEQARDLIGTNAAIITTPVNGNSGQETSTLATSEQYGADDGLLAGDGISVSLVARDGRDLGVLRVSDRIDGTDFTDEDQAVLDQLGRIAATAIESAREYEREHEIATTLQESFLPQELPDVPGLDLAAAYLPSTIGMAVGGDWYDAVPVTDTSVALVVGDVVGHGVRAAAIMGQLRNALRAYLLEGLRPSRVLERLDRMAEGFDAGDFATVVIVELEPATGFIRWSSAGQLPPLVVGPGDDEGSYLEGAVAPPVGSGLPAAHSEATAQLEPGSTLVLYTDGLVESRTQPLDEGLARLRATTVAALGGDGGECRNAGGIVEFLVDELTGPDREDDVAVLVGCMLPRSNR